MTKTLPHDLEAERALLGGCMLDEEAAAHVLPRLARDDFAGDRHQAIAGALLALFQRGEPLDEEMVIGALAAAGTVERAGGRAYVAELVDACPTATNAPHYLHRVQDLALRRRLIRAAGEAAEQARDEGRPAGVVLDDVAAHLADLAADRSKCSLRSMAELVRHEREDIDRRRARGRMQGLATGYLDLDNKLCGLRPGNLIFLAARPSVGKTALALGVAVHVGIHLQQPVLVFSIEMTHEECVHRMMAAEGKIDLVRLLTGCLAPHEQARYDQISSKLAGAPIAIEAGGSPSVLDVRTIARRHKARHGLSLIVIDYLQIMRGLSAENREREVAEVSCGLKALAKELGVPVLALSQLNRALEKRDSGLPQMSDLRDSGSLEQDADLIWFLTRQNTAPGAVATVTLTVSKNRNGPTGPLQLQWVPQFTRFENMARSASAQIEPPWASPTEKPS